MPFRYTAKWICYINTSSHSSSGSFPVRAIREYWVEFTVLCSRSWLPAPCLAVCLSIQSCSESLPAPPPQWFFKAHNFNQIKYGFSGWRRRWRLAVTLYSKELGFLVLAILEALWGRAVLDPLSSSEWSLFVSKANHSVSQKSKSVPQTIMLRSWSWTVLWRRTRLSRTNTQKRCPFHYRGLECKSRKSRNTWSNRQTLPWSTEWSRAKINRVLPREHTHHSKHIIPTTQEKTLYMDITRWSAP